MMRRILIIKPSSIGDVIHTFPCVALIRKAFGNEPRISWVVNESLRGVVELCPGVDRIVPFPRAKMWNVSSIRAFLKELRSEEYDVALDYQGLLKSGLIAYSSRAKLRAGFAHSREGSPFFYNRKVVVGDLHTHAVDKNIQLTREALGIGENVALDEVPVVSIASKPRMGNVVAVCFSSRWESKNWSLDFIADVLRGVAAQKKDTRFLLVGSKDDEASGEKLAQMAALPNVENLAGKTVFSELAAVLASADVLFTVDSGPMHLAAVCGTPCAALFGSTDPVLTGPYGPPGFHAVVRSNCVKAPCFRRKCPLGRDCSHGEASELAVLAIVSHLK